MILALEEYKDYNAGVLNHRHHHICWVYNTCFNSVSIDDSCLPYLDKPSSVYAEDMPIPEIQWQNKYRINAIEGLDDITGEADYFINLFKLL